jgi:hypothetical protein
MAESTFFEAAHERGYRDALWFQRKYGDAAKCSEAIARLISQAMTQLLGGKKTDNLVELTRELQRLAPDEPVLAEKLAELANGLAQPEAALTAEALTALFKAQDNWTVDAAEFCMRKNSQLDLRAALPARLEHKNDGRVRETRRVSAAGVV